MKFIHSIKKNILFFSHFTWYQSHGKLELGFCHGSNSNNPSSGCIALQPPHFHLWHPLPPSGHLGCRKNFPATPPLESPRPDLSVAGSISHAPRGHRPTSGDSTPPTTSPATDLSPCHLASPLWCRKMPFFPVFLSGNWF